MLKALELIGFKSFADRTRFEFPPAVTVVVGPNGSGKSNIVDAIKWVLGAQSVKSLRGKEMVDVIFNGSGARRPINTAEVTLTFDNSAAGLAIDSPEVAVTRRVYRSGEGEYLINRQPCRLRDIRDLFAGTGIATEAYSVIEQGKVDVLLQSSPRDRRVIFEEAAGISRFKAKKLEAARRLERVDQNLLRLSDIVSEVESRLRSVRMQATKAQRYRDSTNRLQELRTFVGLTDWRALTQQFDQLQTSLKERELERDRLAASREAILSEGLALETKTIEHDEAIRGCEARIARKRERIAASESAIEQHRVRCRDVQDEIARHRRQWATMSLRAGGLEALLEQTLGALRSAETQHEQVLRQLANDQQMLVEWTTSLAGLEKENHARRLMHMDLMRGAAKLGTEKSTLASQELATREARKRCQEQIAALRQERSRLEQQLTTDREQQETLTQDLRACEGQLRELQATLAADRRQLADAQKERADLHARHTAASERASVLSELERRMEGLSAGVKQVLLHMRQDPSGPYREVRGLLADLLLVQVEIAPLIEVALGEIAQYFVLSPGDELLERLRQGTEQYQGRVGFLRADAQMLSAPPERSDLEQKPGVVGRADQFVEAQADVRPLVRRLLGRTVFVRTLDDAMTLANLARQSGLTLVTLAGERLAPDGTLVVGPRQASTGLISRRSELRVLNAQMDQLRSQIASREASIAELESQVASEQEEGKERSEQQMQLASALAERRLRTASLDERLEQLGRQYATLEAEARAAAAQGETAVTQLADVANRLADVESELATVEKHIESDSQQLDTLRREHGRLQEQLSSRQVELTKSEHRLESLRSQMAQCEQDQQVRQRALAETRAQLDQCQVRAQQAQRSILHLETELAELHLRREKIGGQVEAYRAQRHLLVAQRASTSVQAHEVQEKMRQVEKVMYQIELEAGQLEHQRTALAQRMREDYDIDLAEVGARTSSDEELTHREELEQEIAELRQKIHGMGSVNLEALEELQQLESRCATLSSQHDDLAQAKSSLEQIISKINEDSRRLFSETLEAVRGHFQSLFRRLFGGGHADIVLDEVDGVDILESGLEIVARPPGKEPRSISLLSGGEKTLTCVALLLAIFRSRPSPFCVLDEVDAALDEANIERFIAVLTEFLSSTQFVVVTHSKKTMTAANTLYGVTMQESGVSKRVSVRFDDVSENGEIRESALQAALDDLPAAEGSTPENDETQAA